MLSSPGSPRRIEQGWHPTDPVAIPSSKSYVRRWRFSYTLYYPLITIRSFTFIATFALAAVSYASSVLAPVEDDIATGAGAITPQFLLQIIQALTTQIQNALRQLGGLSPSNLNTNTIQPVTQQLNNIII
ncbi:hypothetical protein D9758_011227 [Tetrapyrgos nigripes]|uniref:Uncharacterized protein n=1 Tax=Tetrapyrgos nigripes TaxID=182062 RepID=A0A8H5D949_9AGAR|nr:hypothetical protein D9758_011227 [Tetrapyrgos nigripes]